MKATVQHIHIGIKPDYRLYNKLCCMQEALEGMNLPQEEKDARNEELRHLAVLCNRPRFTGSPNVPALLDTLPHRYYPEYTFER